MQKKFRSLFYTEAPSINQYLVNNLCKYDVFV
jgi:hypothetical protein